MLNTVVVKLLKKSRLVSIAAILVTVALLYRQTPSHFFYFDDFDFLSTPVPSSLQEWLTPLNPFHSNVLGWYRPITTFYNFVIYRHLFGLAAFPFMLTNLIALIVNVFLVFRLTETLTMRSSISAIAAFLYGVNFIHFETMSWASGFQEQALAFFSLVTLLSYIGWVGIKPAFSARCLRLISIVTCILAFMSKETAVILPLWLTLYVVAMHAGKLSWHDLLRKLISTQAFYYLILLTYLATRAWAITSRAVGGDAYSFRDIMTALTHYIWFVRWVFDTFLYPIQIIKDIVAPSVHLGWLAWLAVAIGLLLGLIGILFALVSSVQAKIHFTDTTLIRVGVLGIVWFFIGLLPVSLSSNQAAYYLVLPAIGAYLTIACMFYQLVTWLDRIARPVAWLLTFLMIGSVLWGAFNRVAVLEADHTPMFSAIIRETWHELKLAYPTMPPGAEIYLLDFPKEVWPQNSAATSMRLFYANAAVQVIVSSSDVPVQYGKHAYIVRYDGGKLFLISPLSR